MASQRLSTQSLTQTLSTQPPLSGDWQPQTATAIGDLLDSSAGAHAVAGDCSSRRKGVARRARERVSVSCCDQEERRVNQSGGRESRGGGGPVGRSVGATFPRTVCSQATCSPSAAAAVACVSASSLPRENLLCLSSRVSWMRDADCAILRIRRLSSLPPPLLLLSLARRATLLLLLCVSLPASLPHPSSLARLHA